MSAFFFLCFLKSGKCRGCGCSCPANKVHRPNVLTEKGHLSSVLQPQRDRLTRWDLTFFSFGLAANCSDRNRRSLWLLATPLQSCADPKGWPREKGGSGMIEISERVLCCVNTTKKEANFPQRGQLFKDLMVIWKEEQNTCRRHLTAECWQMFLSLVFQDFIIKWRLKPTRAGCGVTWGQVLGWGRSAEGRCSDCRACYTVTLLAFPLLLKNAPSSHWPTDWTCAAGFTLLSPMLPVSSCLSSLSLWQRNVGYCRLLKDESFA